MLSTTWTQAEVTSNSELLEGVFYRLIAKDASNSTAKVTDTIEEIELLEILVRASRTNTPMGEYEKYNPLLIRPFYTPPFKGDLDLEVKTGLEFSIARKVLRPLLQKEVTTSRNLGVMHPL